MNKRVEGTGAMREGERLRDNWISSGEQRTEMEKQKMKSEKVRIFFPDGLKHFGGAWGWRRCPFYAPSIHLWWNLTEFSSQSGHLEVLLEQIVFYFNEFLLRFNVSEPKNNWKFYPTFVLQNPENKEKPAPWCFTLGCLRNGRRRRHHRFTYELEGDFL